MTLLADTKSSEVEAEWLQETLIARDSLDDVADEHLVDIFVDDRNAKAIVKITCQYEGPGKYD